MGCILDKHATKDSHKVAFCIVANTVRMQTQYVKFLTGELWIAVLCEVRLSELRGGHEAQNYLDFVWVPPMLFKYTFGGHVAREDHHVVVALSAAQLTLFTCECAVRERQKKECTNHISKTLQMKSPIFIYMFICNTETFC